MKKMKKKTGFSLVELLIVIGISGILMAIAAPKYQGMIDKAKEVEQKAYIREALNYVDVYNIDKLSGEKIKDTETLTAAEVTINSTEMNELLGKTIYDGSTIANLRQYVEGKNEKTDLTLDVITP